MIKFFICYRYFIPIFFSIMPIEHKDAPQLIWLPSSLFILIFLELFFSQTTARHNPLNRDLISKEHWYYLLILLAFITYCGALNYYQLLSWTVTFLVYILITIENVFLVRLEFFKQG